MADLTLNEFEGVPEEKIKKMLNEEVSRIYGNAKKEKISKKSVFYRLNFIKQLLLLSRRLFQDKKSDNQVLSS